MIPKKIRNGMEGGMIWTENSCEERLFLLDITLNGSHKFLFHHSFPERLNFVSYHAVINLPHLIIGHNHQKLTWMQF